MKKSLIIFSLVIICITFCGCNSDRQKKEDLSSYQWKLESISDLNGKMLATNTEQPEQAGTQCDMQIQFDKDATFVWTDKTDDKVWNGSYSVGDSDQKESSFEVEVKFEGEEKKFTGVCGMRKYANGNEIPSLTFQTEDTIISFVAEKQ